MDTASRYRRFAEFEAAASSPQYAQWCAGIAEDAGVLARIDTLPVPRRQPNLILGATRLLGAPLGPYEQFRDWLVHHWDAVAQIAATHTTQTNEAGRCATLLPQLARIDGPLALLEVGASAGACLFPDRYSYEYRTADGPRVLHPASGPSPVLLPCELEPASAAPDRMPEVVWRAGIDLHPLDLTDPEDLAWLEALVWPEHTQRRERLRQVASVIRDDPPRILRGDAVELLPDLAAQSPAEATLVVFHTAVVLYFSAQERERFQSLMLDRLVPSGAVWLSNESPALFPDIAERMPAGLDLVDEFVLARDGRPVALTNPHGRSYRGF